MIKTCLCCHSEFETKDKRNKFCSLACYRSFNRGVNHPRYGKKHSKETIEKIKEAVKGKSAKYWLGKTHSEETKRKISENSYSRGKYGENAVRWKGGRRISNDGYVFIYKPEHPRSDQHKYIKEHWLVAEKELGRYLTIEEQVHHINETKTDNRPENLYIFATNQRHVLFHKSKKYKRKLVSNLKELSLKDFNN